MAKERGLKAIDPAVALCMTLGAVAGGSGPPVFDVRAIIV